MPPAPDRLSLSRRLLAWLAEEIVLLAIYLLFVGELSRAELCVGAIVAALGVLAWNVVWGEGLARLVLDARLFAQGVRLVVYAFTGTGEILLVLWEQVTGTRAASLFRVARFDPGGEDDRSGTRRALAVGYTTITPNFIVLDVDRQKRRLLYHQIRESEVLEMTRRLGAE